MRQYFHIKEPNGRVAGVEASLAAPSANDAKPMDAVLVFAPADRANGPAEQPGQAGDPALDLVGLAACVRTDPQAEGMPAKERKAHREYLPDAERLVAFARESGPIFGYAEEELRSWGHAAETAFLAVRLQEIANGKKDVSTLTPLERVSKFVARDGEGRERMVIVQSVVVAHGIYRDCLGSLPFARATEKNGRHSYMFAQNGPFGSDDETVHFTVVSLDATSRSRASRGTTRTCTHPWPSNRIRRDSMQPAGRSVAKLC